MRHMGVAIGSEEQAAEGAAHGRFLLGAGRFSEPRNFLHLQGQKRQGCEAALRIRVGRLSLGGLPQRLQ